MKALSVFVFGIIMLSVVALITYASYRIGMFVAKDIWWVWQLVIGLVLFNFVYMILIMFFPSIISYQMELGTKLFEMLVKPTGKK